MNFNFKTMDQEEAEKIALWHYDHEYSFYDPQSDEEDLEELLNPMKRKNYFSTYYNKELVGFFCYEPLEEDGIVTIGLGLKPDWTGRGYGVKFLQSIKKLLTSMIKKLKVIQLSVASFNERAIKVYKRVGFIFKCESIVCTNGGAYQFTHMELYL